MVKNGDKKGAAIAPKVDNKSKDIKKPKATPVKAAARASHSQEEEKHDKKAAQPKNLWDYFALDAKY